MTRGTRNGALLIFIYLISALSLTGLIALMISHNISPGYGICLGLNIAAVAMAVRYLEKDNHLC